MLQGQWVTKLSEKLQKIVRVQKYTCHKYQTTISWDNWTFYILQWQRVKKLNFRFRRKKFFLKNCKNSYEFKNICVINIKPQIDEIIKKWHPCQGKPVFSPTVPWWLGAPINTPFDPLQKMSGESPVEERAKGSDPDKSYAKGVTPKSVTCPFHFSEHALLREVKRLVVHHLFCCC